MSQLFKKSLKGYSRLPMQEFPPQPYSDQLGKVIPLTYRGLVGDAITFSIANDWFKQIGLAGKWNRHLDIGGAEGNHASLFRAARLTRYSESLDIRSFENNKAKRWMHYLMLAANWKMKGLLGVKTHSPKFGIVYDKHSTISNMPLLTRPLVDKMSEEDLFDKKEKYDLVTAFLCMEYFDYTNFFEKVSSILEEGGTFFFLVNYWWYPINATRIAGAVPYACQRFTFDELIEHYQEFFPDKVDAVKKWYPYFHKGQHPTVNQYIEAAYKNDLKLIGAKRIIPYLDKSPRVPITTKVMNRYSNTPLVDVLKDIHRFRKDVELIDLQTGWVMCAFEKASANKPLEFDV